MIKINLAAKKQATYLGSEAGAGKAFSAEDMKDLPLVKIGLTIIVAFVAMTVAKGIMRKELMAEDMKLKTLVQETVKLQAEVSKTDGFKEIQAQLEADELLIKSKIDTIEELAEKRRNLKKVMLSISEVIPPMVWLTDLNLAEKNITIKGFITCTGRPMLPSTVFDIICIFAHPPANKT